MKPNPGKSHLLMSTKTPGSTNIGKLEMQSSDCEKLLGIKRDC